MQSFGKRDYGQVEFDPWAKKSKRREREADSPARPIPTLKIAGYLFALATVGVVAIAGFEILILA